MNIGQNISVNEHTRVDQFCGKQKKTKIAYGFAGSLSHFRHFPPWNHSSISNSDLP